MDFRSLSRRDALKASLIAGLALGRGVPAFAEQKAALQPILKAIPSTGEKIPVIGLGTNAYGVATEAERAPLKEVLAEMSKAGGKVIDTAHAYGRSETVIGELLESLGNRNEYFLATKTPIRGDYSNPKALVDASFTALKTDKIDLLQIHSLGGLKELMPEYVKAKEAGRIRYIGISTSTDDQYDKLAEAMKEYPLDFVQVDYSIENRTAEGKILDLAHERKQAVLINVPFGGRRNAASIFSKVSSKSLPEWAADFDATSWSHFFLKYVVSHPAVTAAIPGTTKVKHMLDNQGAGKGRLPDEATRKKMEEYWATLG